MTTLNLIVLALGLIPAWGKPGANNDNPFDREPVKATIYINIGEREVQIYYWESNRVLITMTQREE